MKGLIEYVGVGIVALSLWLLPRPLGWSPKQTGFALVSSAGLAAWVIMRSQAAILESHQQELLDFKAHQEDVEAQARRAQLAAAQAQQQAQLSAQWQQFQQELEQAAAQKDAQLAEVGASEVCTDPAAVQRASAGSSCT